MDKLVKIALAVSVLMTATIPVRAKESEAPLSPFRKYFWGARQAYEKRDFKKADRLLQKYKDVGSPSDRILTLAGCDTKWEVSLFKQALKDARTCMRARSKSPSWSDVEQAKFAILMAIRRGQEESLLPYVDCAPVDLVPQATTCGSHVYRKPDDLHRLAVVIQKTPAILGKEIPDWREFPIKPKDPDNIPWMLYSESDLWKPCGMPGAPLISLRRDPNGQIRIAGFAASCLEPAN